MGRPPTSSVLALTIVAAACAGVIQGARPAAEPGEAAPLAELWVDPGGTPRDLFWGIGGQQYAPAKDASYRLEARDDAGFSVSYDVVDPQGTEWSAKIGPEAQTEVVVSRLLWGVGYHQPPVYYLPSWTLTGTGEPRVESEARFRPKLARLDRMKAPWSWRDNPFVGTRELHGLLVILIMLNSSDLKDDNNTIYQLPEAWDGARRWFVVRDVGASLGETGKLFPRRNWIDGFEKAGFIARVDGEMIEFEHDGRHQDLFATIRPADVSWAASRLQRLSDTQWRDAFRAGNYTDDVAGRYIRRITRKIDDGLKLGGAAPAAR